MSFRTPFATRSMSTRYSASWQACAVMAVNHQICQAKQIRVLRLTRGPGG